MITHIFIPIPLVKLDIRSANELLILSLACSFDENGLMISNGSLAKLFKTSRRSIIDSINRLANRGYITRQLLPNGRVIHASDEILSLLSSEEVAPLSSEGNAQSGEGFAQSSEAGFTHNLSNLKNSNIKIRNSKIVYRKKQGKLDRNFEGNSAIGETVAL